MHACRVRKALAHLTHGHIPLLLPMLVDGSLRATNCACGPPCVDPAELLEETAGLDVAPEANTGIASALTASPCGDAVGLQGVSGWLAACICWPSTCCGGDDVIRPCMASTVPLAMTPCPIKVCQNRILGTTRGLSLCATLCGGVMQQCLGWNARQHENAMVVGFHTLLMTAVQLNRNHRSRAAQDVCASTVLHAFKVHYERTVGPGL